MAMGKLRFDQPLNPSGPSAEPMRFLGEVAQDALARIFEINMIENGSRAAREDWQRRRLRALINHARTRSPFWRQRIGGGRLAPEPLHGLAVQSRADAVAQVTGESHLMRPGDNMGVSTSASSGSTGTPVSFFLTNAAARYNALRSLAQYFIEGRPLAENRVRIWHYNPEITRQEGDELPVRRAGSWLGPLSRLYVGGRNKDIVFVDETAALAGELLKEPVGYLNCQARVMRALVEFGGVDLLRRIGLKAWIQISDAKDEALSARLAEAGILSHSTYSSQEHGPLGFECPQHPGHYHVAHSNVVIETDEGDQAVIGGVTVSRILVTHLHSHATPFIRYDIGDLAHLHDRCPCGHDGPAVSHINGRGKQFLRRPDGSLVPFFLNTRQLLDTLPCKEFRIRQVDVNTITCEIGGRDALTAGEEDRLRAMLASLSGSGFAISVCAVPEIAWPPGSKRLSFASLVV